MRDEVLYSKHDKGRVDRVLEQEGKWTVSRMADILVLICAVVMLIDIIANIILAVDVLRLIEVSSLDLSKNEDNQNHIGTVGGERDG